MMMMMMMMVIVIVYDDMVMCYRKMTVSGCRNVRIVRFGINVHGRR